MEHATSNANDADGHCRLPRKYIAARAANQRERTRAPARRDGKKHNEKKEERNEENITTVATTLRIRNTLKLMHDYNKLL